MFIEKIKIHDYKILQDIELSFNKEFDRKLFPVGSQNGGGKSTLLQLVFTFLHCSFEISKHEYLQNLFEDIELSEDENYREIAGFQIFDGEKTVDLDFFIVKNKFNNIIERNESLIKIITSLKKGNSNIQNDINDYLHKIKYIDANIEIIKNYRESIVNTKNEKAKNEQVNSLIDFFDKDLKVSIGDDDRLIINDGIYIMQFVEKEIERYNKRIDEFQLRIKDNLKIINVSEFLLSKKYFIKLKNADIHGYEFFLSSNSLSNNPLSDFLKKISEKVFLASPLTQIYHFLAKTTRKSFFQFNDAKQSPKSISQEANKQTPNNYYESLDNSKQFLKNFYTYDYVIVERLKDLLKTLRDKDTEIGIETGIFGTNFNNFLNELNEVFVNKTFKPSKDLQNIYFKLNNIEKEFSPEDLSHGELKYLSIYLWLKINNITDGIVLMDELENNLHPDWQFEIARDLIKWTPDNQFIIATHSYELCNAVTPAHVQELEPKLLKIDK
jgi:predicted ATPase